jgi:pyrroline-5-carboxylate reductase
LTAFTLPGPLWLAGCGNMAGAMLEGWLAAGLVPSQITVIRPSGAPVAGGVRVLTTPPEDEVPAILMLGMKPQKLAEAAPPFSSACDPHTIIVSILAGADQAALRHHFPMCDTIVRVMPNTPVRIRKGAIGLHSDSADAHALDVVERMMAELGTVERVDDESLFDAITALSGSGPAFVYRFIDALAEAGAGLGLETRQALRLALATVEGAGALAAASDENPGRLAERVASPGGSTRKGLDVLDADGRLASLVRETLEAAVRRNREMAEEARRD